MVDGKKNQLENLLFGGSLEIFVFLTMLNIKPNERHLKVKECGIDREIEREIYNVYVIYIHICMCVLLFYLSVFPAGSRWHTQTG